MTRTTRRSGNALFAAAVAVLVAGALATSWVASRRVAASLPDLDPTPVAAGVRIASAPLDHGADATLVAREMAVPPVVAPSAEGLVTEVFVRPGSSVHDGDPVLAVAGARIVGYSGAVLYRPLTPGTVGDDVRTAQRLLRRLVPGSAVTETGTFSAVDLAAARTWARANGYGSVDALAPGWFVYLPRTPYLVATVEVAVGAPAPAPGGPLLAAAAELTDIEVRGTTTGPAGEYWFVAEGQRVPVTRTPDGWQVTGEGEARALLAAAKRSGGTVELPGRTRLVSPEEGKVVPGASLRRAAAADAVCVVLTGAEGRPALSAVRVEVVGSTPDGRAFLRTELPVGTEVVLNPGEAAREVTCR